MRNTPWAWNVILSVTVVAGCVDHPSPPTAPDAAPSFGFTNGPSEPGRSGVFRLEETNGFFVFDAERGLLSLHGNSTPIADLCAGTPPIWDVVDWQLIFSPSGAIQWLQTGDQTVFVYAATEFDCAILVTAPLLASGVTRLVRTDNDLLGFGGPGANAFGWSASGVLTDAATGEAVHYTEVVRLLVWPFSDPGPGEVEEITVAIRLHG